MPDGLEALFPNLRDCGFEIISLQSADYNCIAWAAGETHRLWWPSDVPSVAHWPPGVRRVETIESFVSAFRTLGYEPCENEELEPGFEKVALYVDSSGNPTHMARQLVSEEWTSKIGMGLEDITHRTLRALEGDKYGGVARILKRQRSG